MNYKCDNCKYQICEPPDNDQPHGAFYCLYSHWEGTGLRDQEPEKDPWEWCKDYASKRLVSIVDIADGKYSLDMRGSDNWSKRVGRLRIILKLAAPKKHNEPEYSFMPFYYCKDGYWYETASQKGHAISVFDVEC